MVLFYIYDCKNKNYEPFYSCIKRMTLVIALVNVD